MVKPDDLKKATQSYLTKEDFDALQTLINGKDWNSQDASRSPHLPWYILSFREAGEATIERLRQGCGAKPHDILAKSIKCPKGTEASYMTSKLKLELSETDAEKTYALIKGFVGYYQVGALKGLYLTDLGSAVFKARHTKDATPFAGAKIERPADAKRDVLMITDWTDTALQPLIKKYESCFFTGDYDLLDEIQGKHFVVERAYDKSLINKYPGDSVSPDNEMFVSLNRAMLENEGNKSIMAIKAVCEQVEADFDENLFWKDYKRIQHGPQFGYLAFIVNNELEKDKPLDINTVVADFAYPLCFIHPTRSEENGRIFNVPYNTSVTFVSEEREKAWKEYANVISSYGLEPKHRWGDTETERTKYLNQLAETFKKNGYKINVE